MTKILSLKIFCPWHKFRMYLFVFVQIDVCIFLKSIYILRKLLNFIYHQSWNFRGHSYPSHWHHFSCCLPLRVASQLFLSHQWTAAVAWVAFGAACLARRQLSVFLACRLCLQSWRLCHLKAAVPSYNPSEIELFCSIPCTGESLTTRMRMLYLYSVSRHGFPACTTVTCKTPISHLPAVEILYSKKTWFSLIASVM